MNFELPPFFILKRYRPKITDTHPDLAPVKDISVLISTTKHSNNAWSLNIIDHPQIILLCSEIIQSEDDMWFDSTMPTFSIYSNNKINRIVMKFNNYIIKHNSGCIPVFKMSEPCATLPIVFLNLNDNVYKSFRFELNSTKVSEVQPHITPNSHMQDLINKNENCPIAMIPLTKNNIRITSCGHAFSKDIEKWIVDKETCPVCRSYQSMDTLAQWIFV